MSTYKLLRGSIQETFAGLRTKVQVFGGGYGNGKTAAAVMKALKLAHEYPGSNGLIARATYPKLNDTIRKEFLKWCPKAWIKSFPMSKNSENSCTLTNGSVINFRYISQQGRGVSEGDATTSNLLSATYDWIIVDQMEDPEIVEKDYDDLHGRLRGNTPYEGSDTTMPRSGPRWFIITLNPTRNWVYRRVVAPLHKYNRTKLVEDNLYCRRYPRDHPQDGQPILSVDGAPQLMISMVEGGTHTNAHNLGADYIESLESLYKGQQRDRFLHGEWAAYEGLVYPDFNEVTHCLPMDTIEDYYIDLQNRGFILNFEEGYDFGIATPSCYLLSFSDPFGNVYVIDGYYEKERALDIQRSDIKAIRRKWGVRSTNTMFADPSIYKRTAGPNGMKIGQTVSGILFDNGMGIRTRRGSNEIISGIVKVSAYLAIDPIKHHPITGERGSPHMFFASELEFVASEMSSYYWKMQPSGERVDTPIDRNDHAMDALKYMMTNAPRKPERITNVKLDPRKLWMERE